MKCHKMINRVWKEKKSNVTPIKKKINVTIGNIFTILFSYGSFIL